MGNVTEVATHEEIGALKVISSHVSIFRTVKYFDQLTGRGPVRLGCVVALWAEDQLVCDLEVKRSFS